MCIALKVNTAKREKSFQIAQQATSVTLEQLWLKTLPRSVQRVTTAPQEPLYLSDATKAGTTQTKVQRNPLTVGHARQATTALKMTQYQDHVLWVTSAAH